MQHIYIKEMRDSMLSVSAENLFLRSSGFNSVPIKTKTRDGSGTHHISHTQLIDFSAPLARALGHSTITKPTNRS